MTEIIDVYVVYGHAHPIMPIIGVCSTKAIANEIAKKKGEWGSDGMIWERKAILDTESNEVYLLDKQVQMPIEMNRNLTEYKKEIKEAALLKLNAAELEVLGLNKK